LVAASSLLKLSIPELSRQIKAKTYHGGAEKSKTLKHGGKEEAEDGIARDRKNKNRTTEARRKQSRMGVVVGA